MFRRKYLLPMLLVMAMLAVSACSKPFENTTLSLPDESLRIGFRSSPYGPQSPFPAPSYWVNGTADMAKNFDGGIPSVIWIVGTMELAAEDDAGDFSGRTVLNFPADGKNYENIVFSQVDENEAYLDAFDKEGVQVWLQVEPANADVSTLIELVMDRYADHPCVVGFGVDVEWLKWSNQTPEGVAVSDEEARQWVRAVQTYNPDYQLFLKHWLIDKMPPTERAGLVFVDDSQIFSNVHAMVNEFAGWGRAFSPAPVAFQIGYEADRTWWAKMENPSLEIGERILTQVPNTKEIYWVDFTMEEIWSRVDFE